MVVGVTKCRSSKLSNLLDSVTFPKHFEPIPCYTHLCFAFKNAALLGRILINVFHISSSSLSSSPSPPSPSVAPVCKKNKHFLIYPSQSILFLRYWSPVNSSPRILNYVPDLLYSLLSRPTNSQHIHIFTRSCSVFFCVFFTAVICTYIYINIIHFHLFHSVNIY